VYFIVRHSPKTTILHTVIVKTTIEEVTYITAIGYSGAGVFDEFCGKFHWDAKSHSFSGQFSRLFHDPDLWEYSNSSETTVDSVVLLNDFDKSIIRSHTQVIWEQLIQVSDDSEDRLIRNHLLDEFKTNDYVESADWDPDVVDWVSNHIWGLNYRFDW
jgi:hypothetical protein